MLTIVKGGAIIDGRPEREKTIITRKKRAKPVFEGDFPLTRSTGIIVGKNALFPRDLYPHRHRTPI
jgi:hypothetical protein